MVSRRIRCICTLLLVLALVLQPVGSIAAIVPPVSTPATPVRKLLDKVQLSKKVDTIVKVVIYDVNDNPMGNGSGIIMSANGQVVTNYHVIDMVSRVRVLTSDNRKFEVSGVTAYDAAHDLAVLQLKDATNLPYAIPGNPLALQLGEDIATIGYPLDLAVTVTFGNVSSLNAPGIETRTDRTNIQISAPISPGCSGGPLLNMYGEVVGINYASLVNGQNINYSIPITEVLPLLSRRTLIPFATVIQEVYPTMTMNKYSKWFNFNEPPFKAGGFTFNFYCADIFTPIDLPDTVVMSLDMNPYQYAALLVAEMLGQKQLVEQWLQPIYDRLKSMEPAKNIFISLSLSGSFRQRPTGYTDDEITFNNENSRYEVYRFKVIFTVINGVPQARWK